MIAGVLLGPWLFDAFRHQQFEIKPLNLTVSGVGTPFFISGSMGLIALAILLVFVKEPKRKGKPKTEHAKNIKK